jgi:hypothetical protein
MILLPVFLCIIQQGPFRCRLFLDPGEFQVLSFAISMPISMALVDHLLRRLCGPASEPDNCQSGRVSLIRLYQCLTIESAMRHERSFRDGMVNNTGTHPRSKHPIDGPFRRIQPGCLAFSHIQHFDVVVNASLRNNSPLPAPVPFSLDGLSK